MSINNQPSSIAVFAVPSLATSQFLMSINIYIYIFIYIYIYIHTVYITVHNIPGAIHLPPELFMSELSQQIWLVFSTDPQKKSQIGSASQSCETTKRSSFQLPKKIPTVLVALSHHIPMIFHFIP